MRLTRSLTLLSCLALVLSVLGFTQVRSASAQVISNPSLSNQKVVGLAIKYKAGVSPLDLYGKMVVIDDFKAELTQGSDIGLGYWSATFIHPKSEAQAKIVAEELAKDSRIEAVFLDHFMDKQTLFGIKAKYTTSNASSAPIGVKAADAWISSSPNQARVKLSWSVPARLQGGQVVGYQIAKYDKTTFTYVTAVENTNSTKTYAYLSNNLEAGTSYKFKVAAITKVSSSKLLALGSWSVIATVTPTTIPAVPVLQSASTITSANPQVSWAFQTKAQKGGLTVNYTVTATGSDSSSATCNSTGTSCTLSGLTAQVRYTVQVTASNARGEAKSAVVAEVLDPMIEKQWYLNSQWGINVSKAWEITKGSPTVVVAVLDTGITPHPDLNDNIVTGYDFISSSTNARDGTGRDADPTDVGDYNSAKNEPSSWHGTHVSGIIAAEANDIGISGIAPNVKISPVRVLGVNGGTETDIAAGINWAIGVPISGVPTNKYPAKVINLSIGSSSVSTCYSNSPTQLAIDESKRRDVTLVTAAGNDDHYASASYPGNCYGNITIGATGYYGDRAYYSNYSYLSRAQGVYIGVDISAPGGDDQVGAGAPADGEIWSTINDGTRTLGNPTYGAEEGTSMASPVAAGVVALMYSVRPSLTDDQVWDILSSTARSFPDNSDCTSQMTTVTLNDGRIVTTGLCGVGIIDAGAAVSATAKLNK